ncbi:MAG: threonine/serine dehydratase [Bacteroidetes bacterium]|nr:threonine/serine dehydratase [Bacteroidota bacterium]MDA1119163.1 threonine/serine dehydratase [Bacteroidota bacterium]
MVAFQKPTLSEIEKAHQRISRYTHVTPVLTSKTINEITGADVYFKCENFQRIGAFKMRGASNAILSLHPDERTNGVATHSSGNHAQAVALAAKLTGIRAYIVMPKGSSKVKKEAVQDYGAEIILCENTLASREETLKNVVKKTGARFIHPYDDYAVITGQATAAKELIENTPNLDTIIAPVGGGGLLSGTALSAHYLQPGIKVFGAEPKNVDDAFQSFKAGKIIPVGATPTIADGLKTSLGERNFDIISKMVTDIFTVSEQEIVDAMRLVWERVKIIIEPSSAVPLAVLINQKDFFSGKKVGIIISGGNVDLEKLPFSLKIINSSLEGG